MAWIWVSGLPWGLLRRDSRKKNPGVERRGGSTEMRPLGKAPDSQLTVPFMIDHEGFKRCGLKPYTNDPELGVEIQSRAIEAVVIARK